MKEMSKKERVLAALNRQDVDRTPVANPTRTTNAKLGSCLMKLIKTFIIIVLVLFLVYFLIFHLLLIIHF